MPTRRTILAAATALPLTRPARAATPRDTLVLGRAIDDIVSLDPHEAFEFSSGEVVANTYEKLVQPGRQDATTIEGVLAESWSVDGTAFAFTLRQDARFASGRPVTAGDAAWSLQRAILLDKYPAFILGQLGLAKANVIDAVTAPDGRTLVVRLPGAVAPSLVLYCLTANVASVVDRTTIEARATEADRLGNAWLRQNGAGSGAWVLRSWRASESVVLEANAAHPAPPNLRRVIVRHVPDPAAQMLLLRAGDIDIARGLGAEQIAAAAADPALVLARARRARLLYLGLNQRVPALARPQVRQAVKWAIDYAAIQSAIVPQSFAVQQAFLPQGMPGALDTTPFRRDQDRARALMAEAGLAGGFEVTLEHGSGAPYGDIAQAIQANLASIGIRARLLAGEERQVMTRTRTRQHEMALLRWGSDYFDPHSNAQAFAANPDNGDNARIRTLAWRNAWETPAMTARTDALMREADGAARLAGYGMLQSDQQQDSPFVPVMQEIEVAAVRRNVTGFRLGLTADGTRYTGVVKG